MKYINFLTGFVLVLLLSGCTLNTNNIDMSTGNETEISEAVEHIEMNEQQEVLGDLENQQLVDSPSTDAVLGLLQDVMTNTISTESISFYTQSENTNYYVSEDDSVSENYVIYSDYLQGYMDTAYAYVQSKRSYSHSIVPYEDPNVELIDAFETNINYYLSIEHGNHFYDESEDRWYKEELTKTFKTIDHLADLVNEFMTYSQYVTIDYVTHSHDINFGKTVLQLDLPLELFTENMTSYAMSFFNGYYNQQTSEYNVHTLPTNVLNYNLSLIIDENKHVSSYTVAYQTSAPSANEEDYVQFSMSVDFYDYNKTTVEHVPQIALTKAEPFEDF